jgi:GntR family transcriptional regulator
VKPDLPQGDIDRESPVPFYFQLSELLEAEIVSGRWPARVRLPSEPDLCQHFGVSRTTVRQALARLEQEGLLVRRKGQGTFVRETRPRSWLLQSSEGFFQEEVERMGRTVSSRILRATRCPLPRWATDALNLPPGSDGATIERLRSVDGLVALYVVNHVPAHLAAAALAGDDPDESLYRRLRERDGVDVAGGRRSLEAVLAGTRLARLLELEPRAPVAFIESVSWDRTMRPFDCYRAWLRTDRMRIDIQVASSPALLPQLAARIAAR